MSDVFAEDLLKREETNKYPESSNEEKTFDIEDEICKEKIESDKSDRLHKEKKAKSEKYDYDAILRPPQDADKEDDEYFKNLDIRVAQNLKAAKEINSREIEAIDKCIKEVRNKNRKYEEKLESNDRLRLEISEKLTEEKIEILCRNNLDYLRLIEQGKVESKLHRNFYESMKKRDELLGFYSYPSVAFRDEQVAFVHDILVKVRIACFCNCCQIQKFCSKF